MHTVQSRKFAVCLLLWAAIGIYSLPVRASGDVTRCDVLVAHPSDPDRVTAGVSSAAVNHEEGIAACRAAVGEDSANPRLNYQLARVLFYAGQSNAAIPYLEKAAAADYRQAQFVLGYILAGAINGVEQDLCRTEELWSESARNGRLAALISYPHHVVRGRFESCEIHVAQIEMAEFLTQARTHSLDYYQRILVDDVAADLEKWSGNP